MSRFLTDQALDLNALVTRARRPDHGALLTFVGSVRDHHLGRTVTAIDYSAYGPMAERILSQLVAETEARWPAVRVHCQHRIGHLEVGDDAVHVVVGSAHRAEAYAASIHFLERLKADCPIWKKEWDEAGGSYVSNRP
jgi:molybdopterin synthase catalytic subunit